MEFEVWRLEGEREEEKERGRMFSVDDEKKLERFFGLAGSGRKREGKGRGTAEGKEVLVLLVC